jgi:DNA-binding CsgD family transcriptional regulator
MERVEEVVDQFRCAALGMGDWKSAVEAFGGMWNSSMVHVGVLRQNTLLLNLLAGIAPDDMGAYFAARGDDPTVNPRTGIAFGGRPFVSLTDDEFILPEMRQRAIYQGLFRHYDIPHSIVLPLGRSHDLQMAAVLMYPTRDSVPEARQRRLLEHISPMIKQVLAQSVALGTNSDTCLAMTAERIGGAAVLLGTGSSIVAVSPAAEPFLRDGTYLSVRNGRLVASGAGAAVMARAYDSVVYGPAEARPSTSAVLRPTREAAPLVVDLCPIPAAAFGPLSLGQILLTLRVRQTRPGAVALLRAAFDLTAAEAEVAMLVGAGVSVEDIAERRGSTVATTRTQLRALFEKTGTRRQVELALLVVGFG